MRNQEKGGGGEGGVEGAESSIIEENLTAAERTIASFYPGRVNDFVVDLIALRFSPRNETLSAVKSLSLRVIFSWQALWTFQTSACVHPVWIAVI